MTDKPEVTGVDGSFYEYYKRDFLALLDFVRQSGAQASSLENLSVGDAAQLRRYTFVIDQKKNETFRLLATRIDEANPSFFDECIVENILQLAEAMFMVGQYAALSNKSTRRFVKSGDADKARDEKSKSDSKVKRQRLDLLRRFIGDREINAYSKFIVDELGSINAAAKEARVASAGKSTWTNLMKELGYGPRPKKDQG